MRLELARTRPELLPTLHLRAARWFEEAGDLESATDHAIESRDVAGRRPTGCRAGRVIGSAGALGDHTRLVGGAVVAGRAGRPRARMGTCHVRRLRHDLDGAEQWLDIASNGVPEAVGSLSLPLGYRVEMLALDCGSQRCRAWRGGRATARSTSPQGRCGRAPRWPGSDRRNTYGAKPPRHETTLRRAVA